MNEINTGVFVSNARFNPSSNEHVVALFQLDSPKWWVFPQRFTVYSEVKISGIEAKIKSIMMQKHVFHQ